jgi:hypothetical protein
MASMTAKNIWGAEEDRRRLCQPRDVDTADPSSPSAPPSRDKEARAVEE